MNWQNSNELIYVYIFRAFYDTQQCQKNMTPIIFSIYSDMCVMGDCGKYGRCYQFFSGGNMFSTCTCYAGKKCWLSNIVKWYNRKYNKSSI